ncbi:restriction endonuclease subunit S [Vibrio splendidus]
MTGRYKAYPEYKKTDIKFLNGIPTHWVTSKVRHISVFGRGLAITKANLQDTGIPCVSYGEVHSKFGFEIDPKKHSLKCVSEEYLTSSPYALLSKGDFVFADTSEDIDGSGNFTQLVSDETLFAGYHTVIVRPDPSNYYRFVAYLFDSPEFRSQVRDAVKGVKVFSVTQAILKDASVWLPSYEEQQKIANFLDHETVNIDSLIAKQEKLIELLKEKRQAVISHAVTKGLKTDAPMKDSGVEWLGEIPEHWGVTRFKFLCENIIAGPFGSSITKDMYVKSGFKVYGQEQVIPNNFSLGDYFISAEDYLSLERYKVSTGDVLISCVGTFGKVAVFPSTAQAGIINPRLIKAKIHKHNSPYFIREYLKSVTVAKQFDQFSRGGTMGVINIAILNEIVSTKPPYVEQCEIYDFIKAQKSKFSLLLDRCEKQIALLKERKTALISAAVTGKIDVRDWRAE